MAVTNGAQRPGRSEVSLDCSTEENFRRQRHIENRTVQKSDQQYLVNDGAYDARYRRSRSRQDDDDRQSVRNAHLKSQSSHHEVEYETVDEVSEEEMPLRRTVDYQVKEAEWHKPRKMYYKAASRQTTEKKSGFYDSDSDSRVN